MTYRFADCELDPGRHRLTRGGTECHVEPQVFALLELLAERAGEVVRRDDIVARVWNGRIVSEATISARIAAARAAVGDDGRRQAIIRTVTRVGLQMVAKVSRSTPSAGIAPPEVEVRMATARDGAGLAWCDSGSGAPILRAGHWMTHLERDLTSPIWGPWLQALGQGRRLVRYDLRGTGLSDRNCGAISLDLLAEDLEAVADAAGLGRFSIFAASQAVPVACVFAARHPARVARLVLYGGFAVGPALRGNALAAAMPDMIRRGWGKPASGYMKSFSTLFLPDASEAFLQGFIELQFNSATPDWAARIREALAGVDVTELLPKITAPTLVAHAVDDSVQPFAQAQLLARLIPDARLKQIDSANHVLLPDEPGFRALMTAVDGFLTAEAYSAQAPTSSS